MTSYDQVGGEPTLEAAVELFYERIMGDPDISPWFEGIDLGQLKHHQRAFLAVGLGGPEHYDGRSMRNAHSGLGITDDAFTRAVEHLTAALAELGIAEPTLRQVVKRIEMMRAAIVQAR